MKTKNIFWISAGALSLLTALVHLVAGQMDLVKPLFKSDMTLQMKTEWLSVWHIITVLLFYSSFYVMKQGMKPEAQNIPALRLLALLYVLFALVFVICSIAMKTFAPQWILLLPIGLLTYLGIRRMKSV